MKPMTCLLVVLAFGSAARADDIEFFEKKIRPLLVEHCYSCHSDKAKKIKGGLRLDSREAALKGGETGPAVVPGSLEKSLLIEAITYKNVDLLMPPKGKLSDSAVADLTAWVKSGSPWPAGAAAKEVKKIEFDLAQRKRDHWSWQPIKPATPPDVKNLDAGFTPVDRFLVAKLREKNLEPASLAEPRVLLRRLHFDITGLPPTPQEVIEFEKSFATQGAKAIEAVADRLLASPQFGERWGRHWLDLMRYAESRGHEFDPTLPNAYQYRDYVIRALNADVPYDQFTREHLAGDLMTKPRLHAKDGFNESILGTGFLFLGEQVHSPVDICQDKADRFDNMIDVLSKTFLGLTVSCARCHDHKFDAISAKDYYSLSGFLESGSYRLVPFETLEHNRRVAAQLSQHRADSRAKFTQAMKLDREPVTENLADYLEEARAVVQGKPSAVPESRRAKLDAKLVPLWADHLKKAVKNPRDPFHGYACATQGVAPSWQKKEAPPTSTSEVIVDYQTSGSESWLPDGFAFGTGPLSRGMLRFGPDTKQPIVGFAKEAAAEKDALWDGLKSSKSDNEPGALGRTLRAGRTIRTPKVDLTTGLVHFRARGNGMVYAAVEGHVMIQGPLHGSLVKVFAAGPEFRWQTIDLTPYKGRRVHFEFTPESGDFALAQVTQGAAPPNIDLIDQTFVESRLQHLYGNPTNKSLVEQAEALQEGVRFDLRLLATGEPKATSYSAHMNNWFLEHQHLFGPRINVDKAAAEFFAEQAKLASQIRMESRLAPAILDGNGVTERVFIRGNYKTPGDVTPRRLLEALVGPEQIKAKDGSGRLELAGQITDPAINPFFTRVFVNRVWHHLFGRGLVGSVDNFGVLGEVPTHPELLDYLADQFAREGFSQKKLIRSLVLTRTYQMSSRPSDDAKKTDPTDLLLQHTRVRRLEGEAIRDALLAISGRLDPTPFGNSVPVSLNDFQQGRGRPASGPLDGAGRRSVYLAVRRNFLSSFLLAFDTPIPFSTVGRRTISNVPAQALILLNDPFVHQQAEIWAKKTLAEPGSMDDRVRRLYLAAYARQPSPQEITACREFLTESVAAGELPAWASLCHVLVNAKEFIFLE